ncbi:hypothetical protein [Ferrovum sp.]|uniref:hypothetical protein n=1 Tax=Ferrovum sp. TaxID=2609467 RepID=UPI002638943B|nr:hypothetical protein [Ferrovum sp.]
MTNKQFFRRTKSMSQNQWQSGIGSRKNTRIFLRSGMLRERSIARPSGRAWIETKYPASLAKGRLVSPGHLVERRLERSWLVYRFALLQVSSHCIQAQTDRGNKYHGEFHDGHPTAAWARQKGLPPIGRFPYAEHVLNMTMTIKG